MIKKEFYTEGVLVSEKYFPKSEREDFGMLIHAIDDENGQEVHHYSVPLNIYIKALEYLYWAEKKITSLTSELKSVQVPTEKNQSS